MTLMDRVKTSGYNCAHYVADMCDAEGLPDVRHVLVGFLDTPENRTAKLTLVHDLRLSMVPIDPSIVLFRRRGATPHVGLYIRGMVTHLTNTGPIRQLLDVAGLGFTSRRFYALR